MMEMEVEKIWFKDRDLYVETIDGIIRIYHNVELTSEDTEAPHYDEKKGRYIVPISFMMDKE